jgi:hypothetical protein
MHYSLLPNFLINVRRRYWGDDMSELIADDVIDSLDCISCSKDFSKAFYLRYADLLLEISGNLDSKLP